MWRCSLAYPKVVVVEWWDQKPDSSGFKKEWKRIEDITKTTLELVLTSCDS